MDQYYGFASPELYPAEDVHTPSTGFSFDVNLLDLSPPFTTPEQSATPDPPHLPCFDLSPITQPPADTQQTPVQTSPVPVAVGQPTPQEIKEFDYCPYTTKEGKVCGFVSWASSGSKTISRHLKRVHFKSGTDAKGWVCPNLTCKRGGFPFQRKDSLMSHRRKTCDPRHAKSDPDYIPQPHIERGSDAGVKGWINAGREQRNYIREQLTAGIPWSEDLIQPTSL